MAPKPCGDGIQCISGDNGKKPLPPTPPPPPPGPPSPGPPAPNSNYTLLLPSHNHLQFHDDNIGAIIHFNMQTYLSVQERRCCGTHDPSLFNPTQLSTDQWVSAAASFGARYVVLVVDHFSGYVRHANPMCPDLCGPARLAMFVRFALAAC